MKAMNKIGKCLGNQQVAGRTPTPAEIGTGSVVGVLVFFIGWAVFSVFVPEDHPYALEFVLGHLLNYLF